ncbi:MAG: amino acid ABC transporter permease [Gammaproteobacteria bacterium]
MSACWTALWLSLVAIVLSWGIGLFTALAKMSNNPLARWPAEFFVWFIRGTPSLIQIFIIYFGLPQLGLRLDPFSAGVLALGICSGAYVAEVFRAGFMAIPRGQSESAIALGLGPLQTLQRVILPQVVRIIVPALTNEAVNTLKNTSLLSTITVVELTLYIQTAIAATFRPFDFYMVAAILYLAMCSILMLFAGWYERRNVVRL